MRHGVSNVGSAMSNIRRKALGRVPDSVSIGGRGDGVGTTGSSKRRRAAQRGETPKHYHSRFNLVAKPTSPRGTRTVAAAAAGSVDEAMRIASCAT